MLHKIEQKNRVTKVNKFCYSTPRYSKRLFFTKVTVILRFFCHFLKRESRLKVKFASTKVTAVDNAAHQTVGKTWTYPGVFLKGKPETKWIVRVFL